MVEFRVELFDKESPLLAYLHLWADAREFPFHKDVASDFGYMAFYEEKPIAAVFMYPVMGATFVLLGFPMANPKSEQSIRHGAISAIVAESEKAAKLLNRKFIVSYAGSKGAVSMFNRLGYEQADKDVVQYIKYLGV